MDKAIVIDPVLERFKLVSLLNSLDSSYFEQILFSLSAPESLIPPRQVPQSQRTVPFLRWVESPQGPGLNTLMSLLREIPGSDIAKLEKATYPRLRLTLEVNDSDLEGLQAFIAEICSFLGDSSLKVVDVNRGSLIVDLAGNTKSLRKLKALVDSGELSNKLPKELYLATKVKSAKIVRKPRILPYLALLPVLIFLPIPTSLKLNVLSASAWSVLFDSSLLKVNR